MYGSRHLAKKWSADGTNARLKALINIDMIGQKDLHVVYEMGSAATVRNMVWNTGAGDGLYRHRILPLGWQRRC